MDRHSLYVTVGARARTGPLRPSTTFTAELNGRDVSALFRPGAGSGESVRLPLAPGRNVLKLSVQGTAGARQATDTDRLVFVVG